MAKSQLPMPSTGGGVLPKIAGVVLGLAVLTLVVKQPVEAAQWTVSAGKGLSSAVESVSTFLQHVHG